MAILPMASAVIYDFGTFKQGQEINLIQICASCTSNNITAILYPNSTVAIADVEMTPVTGIFNYTLSGSLTDNVGRYLVNGIGNPAGVNTEWNYEFYVTKSGENYSNFNFLPMILVLFAIIFMFSFLAVSLAGDHAFISIFFILLSLFLLNPLLGVINVMVENGFSNSALMGQLEVFNTLLPWIMYGVLFYILTYILIKAVESWQTKKKFRLGLEGLE